MQTIKGFLTVRSRVDNSTGQVSAIGELSPHSRTYSKEKGLFSLPDFNDLGLTVFSSKDESGVAPVTETQTRVVLTTADWIDRYVRDNVTSENPQEFKTRFTERFTELSDIEVGEMVNIGSDYYPSRVNYTLTASQEEFVIWFADSKFRTEYDEYEIEVIHPIDNVSKLLEPIGSVRTELAKISFAEQINRITAVENEYPATAKRSLEYTWYDQNDDTQSLTLNWTLAIYGAAGDTSERLQSAIIDTVKKLYPGRDTEWQAVIPDLFSPTEFYVVPCWHAFSIPEQLQLNGIHSPIVSYKDIDVVARVFMGDEGEAHRRKYMETMATIYKSLSLISLGKKTNRDNSYQLSDMFPDYMIVSTASADFARLSPRTQKWVILLHNMLATADRYGSTGILPEDMTVVSRNGIDFIMATFENRYYLVAERGSYMRKYEAEATV